MVDSKLKNSNTSIVAMIKSKVKSQRSVAFEEIYVSYYPVFEKFVLSKNGNHEEAKDLFQEGITILYIQIINNKFREESNIKTYLFSICRNLFYQQIKKKQKENEMEKNQPKLEIATSEEQPQDEKVLAVFQVFNTLGKDCQRILELFYFEKLSMTEIAKEFGFKGEQSAKNKKSKCIRKLRSMIEAEPSVYSLFYKK